MTCQSVGKLMKRSLKELGYTQSAGLDVYNDYLVRCKIKPAGYTMDIRRFRDYLAGNHVDADVVKYFIDAFYTNADGSKSPQYDQVQRDFVVALYDGFDFTHRLEM